MSSNSEEQITPPPNKLFSGLKDILIKNKKVFIIVFVVLLAILFIYICREKIIPGNSSSGLSLKEKIAEFNKLQNYNIKSLGN